MRASDPKVSSFKALKGLAGSPFLSVASAFVGPIGWAQAAATIVMFGWKAYERIAASRGSAKRNLYILSDGARTWLEIVTAGSSVSESKVTSSRIGAQHLAVAMVRSGLRSIPSNDRGRAFQPSRDRIHFSSWSELPLGVWPRWQAGIVHSIGIPCATATALGAFFVVLVTLRPDFLVRVPMWGLACILAPLAMLIAAPALTAIGRGTSHILFLVLGGARGVHMQALFGNREDRWSYEKARDSHSASWSLPGNSRGAPAPAPSPWNYNAIGAIYWVSAPLSSDVKRRVLEWRELQLSQRVASWFHHDLEDTVARARAGYAGAVRNDSLSNLWAFSLFGVSALTFSVLSMSWLIVAYEMPCFLLALAPLSLALAPVFVRRI
jgi:hypothetical protein